MNKKDPQFETLGRALFERLSAEADGAPGDVVLDATINMFVNAVRQTQSTREGAMTRIDELLGAARKSIDRHYGANGKRLNGIFPFDQLIEVPFIQFKSRFLQDI